MDDLNAITMLILALGTTRAVQIALWDRITEAPRGWLQGKLNPEGLGMHDPGRGYLSYALECVWCSSVWIGLATAALFAWETTRVGLLIIEGALALSLLAVVIDRMVDRWLPDEAPPQATGTLQVGDLTVTGPPDELSPFVEEVGEVPTEVAEAFAELDET